MEFLADKGIDVFIADGSIAGGGKKITVVALLHAERNVDVQGAVHLLEKFHFVEREDLEKNTAFDSVGSDCTVYS